MSGSVTFHGAAQEVTGSCHVVRAAGATVMLDCGMFQGRRRESAEKNRTLPLDVAELTAVVLSHAHIDHSGRLPFLVAAGYAGPIYCTPATRDLCALMLADSAHIQTKDAEFLLKRGRDVEPPLYGQREVIQTLGQMIAVPYGRPFPVAPGITGTFVDAGHILGSASVLLDVAEHGHVRRLVFSGDIGRKGLPIIRDPEPPTGAHALILESTYGNREHASPLRAREELARVVRETAARGGRVMIPSFAVGRTQELIYELHELLVAEQIPEIPIIVDSPLATAATDVFELHPEAYDRSEGGVRSLGALFRNPCVRYTHDVQESIALNSQRGPMVIISASGMAESGRILHHLSVGAPDPRNTILVVGFMAEHTLGRRIVERRQTIKVFGDEIPLRAEVEIISGYSAHADRVELRQWASAVQATSPSLGPVFLVHGEAPAQTALSEALAADGFAVTIPSPGTPHAW
jgi:metallo-beta-lactamase family protein